MNYSRGRAPEGALVSVETQYSPGRGKVAGAPQCSHVRQYNLILAFPSHCLFHFCLLLWGFLLYEDILKSTAKPLVDAQRCVRSITNAFSRQCLAHRHTSEPRKRANSAGKALGAVRVSVDKRTPALYLWGLGHRQRARRGRRRSQGQRRGQGERKRDGKRRDRWGFARALAEHLLVEQDPWAHDELEDVLQGFDGFVQLLIDSRLLSTGHVGP